MAQTRKPTLIVTLGFPGSGKSFFARQFAERQGWLYVNADHVRATIAPKPQYTRAEAIVVRNTMAQLTEEALKRGQSVMYDANRNQREKRQELWELARQYRADYRTVWVRVPVDVAKERLKQREDRASQGEDIYPEEVLVSGEIFERMRRSIEPPQNDEPYIELNGEWAYDKQETWVLEHLLQEE